ncbi:MAG TPA: HlyD family efflux transporter periplasmic adaptor subunit [Blastocatellia bacterium]|nr:HlyD family efflux transporter periplasmic adaptor subunit [Blastocatellia bacterium]
MRSQSTIFREEALERHFIGGRAQGDLLRISSRWTNWAYWFLVAVLVAGSIYVVFGRINEYATGTAVIRDEGRTIVTALTGGSITEIAVQPGQRVEAHQLLLRFNDGQERIELERLQRELNLQQISWLKNPGDPTAQQQLATVRSQIGAAEKRLNERSVGAPRAGVVRDIRIRPNQQVVSGELLLSIVGDDDALLVVAILPGHYRPLLKPGNPLRLELTGFRYAYQRLTIDSIGNEVIGPNEVRRFLGQEIADSLALQGASVIVQARLPARKFEADGRWREYHDGMSGTAEARVGSESILLALAPGLKAVFGGGDE